MAVMGFKLNPDAVEFQPDAEMGFQLNPAAVEFHPWGVGPAAESALMETRPA